MNILAHRGLWRDTHEKNSPEALTRALSSGFGVETDIRDLNGQLVISHDMPVSGTLQYSVRDFLSDVKNFAGNPLALNIKSDGLASELLRLLEDSGTSQYFVFDMSIPDELSYRKLGFPIFGRTSEVEPITSLARGINGVWLDSFGEEWWHEEELELLLGEYRNVCVVSPELHGRPHANVWKLLHSFANDPGLHICTDFPEEARSYFNGD